MISERIREALAPGWRWLLAIGVGVPLLLGLVLASAVAISWLTGSEYERPLDLEAGRAGDYAIAAPKLFEEDDVWVVRLLEGDFLALYDRGLESGCPLQWRSEFGFMDRTGWFVDACTGSAYDLTGRCFSEACRGRPLDRFSATLDGDNVVVDLRVLHRDLPADAAADPVNPPGE
ncbi:MAG: hypothetical protein ACRDH5_04605 [bacterium]